MAQTWSYDSAGNWNSTTTINGNATITQPRNHSEADELSAIDGNATTHDAKGNLTSYEVNAKDYTVVYDLDNRISEVEVDNTDVEYRYDAFGRRVVRKEGSAKTSLIWWGDSECAEHKHQAGQTVIQNDVMEHPTRLNSVIARAVDGSKFKLQWYHKNYLDHVYAVSNDNGDLLEHYRYTAFGEVTIYDEGGTQIAATQIENTILWNTRRKDAVSGYYLYKYRHYAPELGRWPSRDPIGERGGVNNYGFIGNSPTQGVDYLGLVLTMNPVEDTQQAVNKAGWWGSTGGGGTAKNPPAKGGPNDASKAPDPDKEKCNCFEVSGSKDFDVTITTKVYAGGVGTDYTQAGLDYIRDHEDKRRLVYENGYNAYLLQFEATIIGSCRLCGLTGTKANKYIRQLKGWLGAQQTNMRGTYSNYVKVEQVGIGTENVPATHNRDAQGLFTGGSVNYTVNAAPAVALDPCPNPDTRDFL